MLHAAAAAAVVVPSLIAFQLPPSSTYFNQVAALALWGVFVALAAWRGTDAVAAALRAAAPLLAVLALLAAAAVTSSLAGSLPASIARAHVGVLAAAAIVVVAGAVSARADAAVAAVLWALMLAGVASSAIALFQVFAPTWADGRWIAVSTLPGRAVGNLRQPNHLATLLLWSAIALLPVASARRWPWACAAMALLGVAIELTGSRTGALGVALLGLWGLFDRRLGALRRALLLAAPLSYLAAAGVLWLLAQHGGAVLGAETRGAEGDLSSSRFAIWANTLALIAMQPWTGVGWGRFNFAWSLTPFPGRPVAFFDHTHNLPLQFAVELGVPLAMLVLGLLAWALARAARRTLAAGDDVARRALLMMVLLAGVHSLLEYPLWYLHLLLPAAWLFGAVLAPPVAAPVAGGRRRPWLPAAGVAMVLAAAVACVDYLRVARIYAPGAGAAPLAQRIADGQRSPLNGHHADYAAATVAPRPSLVLPAIQRAAHQLLDTRLMIAWARAEAEVGRYDRARHLAQRLREFHNPASRDFFAPCGGDGEARPLPWQCESPIAALDWRDFVP